MTLQTLDIAHKIVDAVLNRHASDILLLDVHQICSFTDYFILCNGESERQLRAISDEIEETLSELKVAGRRHQGNINSGWIIHDLGDIVVHIFSPEKRRYYNIEEMWSGGDTVIKIL